VLHVMSGLVALVRDSGFIGLALVPQEDLIAGMIDRHGAFVAEKDISDEALARSGNRRFAAGRETADLEDQFGVAIIEARGLRIRRLLVVVVDVLAAVRSCARRQPAPESPTRDVHLMNALIADV